MTSEEIVAGYENILAAIPENYFDRYTAEELGISEDARKTLNTMVKKRFEEKRNSPEWRLFEETIAYEQNLPFYPEDYFEKKTAEELRISEEARQILIQRRKEAAELKMK